LGKATIVDSPAKADFVIVGNSKNPDDIPPNSYTWDEFVVWLLDKRFLTT